MIGEVIGKRLQNRCRSRVDIEMLGREVDNPLCLRLNYRVNAVAIQNQA